MIDEQVKELVIGERKFLHDIANHIVVAHGMANFVMRAIKDQPGIQPKEIERLGKSLDAINKMTELLKERRTLLHSLYAD